MDYRATFLLRQQLCCYSAINIVCLDVQEGEDMKKENRIKVLRQKNNISQSELANQIGVTRQAISLYENEERKMNDEIVTKIANYFNVTKEYVKGYGYSIDFLFDLLYSAYKSDFKFKMFSDDEFKRLSELLPNRFKINQVFSARKIIDEYFKLNDITPERLSTNPFDTIFDDNGEITRSGLQTQLNWIVKLSLVKQLLNTKDFYTNDAIKRIMLNTINSVNYALKHS